MFLRAFRWFVGVLFTLSATMAAAAFPDKPITIIVPAAPGAASDLLARAVGRAITEQQDVPVVIENRPGGNGFVGALAAVRAKPDGYTLFLGVTTTQSAPQHLYKSMPYDPEKDFAPITGLGRGWQVFTLRSDSPYRSLADFVQAARKEPGALTFGSGNATSRIAAELFQQSAGIKLLYVPYRSNNLAVAALVGGEIDMMIPDTTVALPHINSGKLHALGVTSSKRVPMMPDVPALAEEIPGFEIGYWFAAYAPAGTPPDIVTTLNKILHTAQDSKVVKDFLENTGIEPFSTSPEELAAFQAKDSETLARIISNAGIEKQ